MIPETFEQWKSCIEKECKIELTQEFINNRLAVYRDKLNTETLKFISLYGEKHLNNVISWFERVKV